VVQTRATVTVAALLHPNVPRTAVDRFGAIASDLEIVPDVRELEHLSAVLIFGGDGTIHRHLPELHRRRIPTLVVPKGSGNDFAKALGITNEKVALAAWKTFCQSGGTNVREIDLGVIQGSGGEVLFCCVTGAGLDSAANSMANRMPSWLRGAGGYLLAAVQSLMTFEPTEFRLNAEGRETRKRGFFVAVGNAHRYGRGMKVAPQAELDDGQLDICLVGAMNRFKLLCCVPTVFAGAHLRIKEVEYFRAPRLGIETGRPLDVYADGEFACTTPVEIGLLPRAFRVIVPA